MSEDFNRIKIGDLVTAYEKGYWRVVGIERRYISQAMIGYFPAKELGDEYNPLVKLELVVNSKLNKPKARKPRTSSCDMAYCTVITREWIDEQQRSWNILHDALLGKLD